MRRLGAALLSGLLALPLLAAPLPELALREAVPVEGMPRGNLSGLARCGGEWVALTDRDDDRLFVLTRQGAQLVATPQLLQFERPALPPLSLTLSMAAGVMGSLRGGSEYDFEGLECDAAGNRYLVSETFARVLKVSPQGEAQWLALPDALYQAATAAGLLQKLNAVIEGLAVSPDGQRLWLAAERESRGLLQVELVDGQWQCAEPCISQVEHRVLGHTARGQPLALDFAGLTLHQGHLFTLERLERRICRRAADSGELQRCWSFARASARPELVYPGNGALAEALWLDADAAWVALDNGGRPSKSGETRSLIMHLAAPKGGWLQP